MRPGLVSRNGQWRQSSRGQLLKLMASCRVVATDTQTRYGTWAIATHRYYCQMAIIIRMIVAHVEWSWMSDSTPIEDW